MTVLLTGGNGFIGSALAETLLERGSEVVSLDVSAPPDISDPGYTAVDGDVTDYEGLRTTFREFDPDAVVNLAYLLGAESEENPHAAIEVNCLGMDNVMRLAGEFDVSRVVYASSVSVYGTPDRFDDAVTETTAPPAAFSNYPSMFYNATKQLNEYQGRMHADRHGYTAVAIRPSMVYGPGRGGGMNAWIADFVRKPVSGETGYIPYLPDRSLSLVYVEDVAELFAAAALEPHPVHHSYNTGGIKVTAAELAGIVEEELGGRVECVRDPEAELRPLVVASETNDRAVEEFDIELTPLRDGIQKYERALREAE